MWLFGRLIVAGEHTDRNRRTSERRQRYPDRRCSRYHRHRGRWHRRFLRYPVLGVSVSGRLPHTLTGVSDRLWLKGRRRHGYHGEGSGEQGNEFGGGEHDDRDCELKDGRDCGLRDGREKVMILDFRADPPVLKQSLTSHVHHTRDRRRHECKRKVYALPCTMCEEGQFLRVDCEGTPKARVR